MYYFVTIMQVNLQYSDTLILFPIQFPLKYRNIRKWRELNLKCTNYNSNFCFQTFLVYKVLSTTVFFFMKLKEWCLSAQYEPEYTKTLFVSYWIPILNLSFPVYFQLCPLFSILLFWKTCFVVSELLVSPAFPT